MLKTLEAEESYSPLWGLKFTRTKTTKKLTEAGNQVET